jgi:membrane fusion protein, multidrug efflux system
MKKRMTITLILATGFLVSIGSMKYFQIRAAMAAGASFQPPPEAVTTVTAALEPWAATLGAIGTVVAVHGVTVSADLPGVVAAISFDSGRTVRAGDELLRLDTSQEEAQLAAARAQQTLARLNLERLRGLREKGVIAQAEIDRSVAEREQAEARVGEIEATIGRKTIRAPFGGILGIRQANLGQYLNAGDPVVPLQSLDPIYVNFSVPQQEIGKLRRGGQVRVTAEGVAGSELVGSISAVNSVVDEATRNIQVQATLPNPEQGLRPGMFVEALVMLGDGGTAVTLPASAISFAPYGDSVFVVEDLRDPQGRSYRGVRQQFVKLGRSRGDQVAVLKGVHGGEVVVSSGAFKLRNGAAVLVNNEVQPANEAAPRPEDS